MKEKILNKKSIALALVASLIVGILGGVQSVKMADAAEKQRSLNSLTAISNAAVKYAENAGESGYAYYEDFNSMYTSDDLTEVATASSGSTLELKNDLQHGGYLKHTATDGNKSLGIDFGNDAESLSNYTVEVDVLLKPGDSGSVSELLFTDMGFDMSFDKENYSSMQENYIFKLGTTDSKAIRTARRLRSNKRSGASSQTTWYINDGKDGSVDLPDSTWITIRLVVTDSTELDWEIIRRGTTVSIGKATKKIDITDTDWLQGIYALTSKDGETSIDNIRVSPYSENITSDTLYTFRDRISITDEYTGAVSSIQWYRTDDKNSAGVKIPGAVNNTYTLAEADAGNFVYAIINEKTRIFFINKVQGIDIEITGATISEKQYDGTKTVSRSSVAISFAEVISGTAVNNLDYDTSQLEYDSQYVGTGRLVSGKIVLIGDLANCYTLVNGGQIYVTDCEIIKGTPDYESLLPAGGYTARAGQTLASVALPSGFKWNDPTASVGTTPGNRQFTATYTPDDTVNYNIVSNISITITVTASSSVASSAPGTDSSTNPSAAPSANPSGSPAVSASVNPSGSPNASASVNPSGNPSANPSGSPSASPGVSPLPGQTVMPTATPRPTRTPLPDEPFYPDEPDESDEPVVPTKEPLPAVDADVLTKNKLGLNKKMNVTWENKTLCVSWGTVSGTEGYDVYAAVVGDSFTNSTIVQSLEGDGEDYTNVRKVDGDSLGKDMYYKVKVRTYRMIDGRKQGTGGSLTLYIAARKDSYYTNVKKIKVKKSSYTLKKGKTAKISRTLVKEDKSKTLLKTPGTKVRYISSNTAVAKVDENGKIKAVSKGSCTIYAIALNGVRKKISVKVKN